jgi:ABC-type glycerol-3-phosphate transport system substrate-binding protein
LRGPTPLKGHLLRKLHLLLPLALLALALGLAACGGGGGEGDEDKIAEAIETATTSDDPAICKELETQAFVEQTEFTKGKEALENCEASADETEDNADSVEVSGVKITGSRATADAAFSGGNFDGQTLSLALVKEGGDWKLNEVVRFKHLDQPKLVDVLVERLESGDDGLPPELAGCIGDELGELSPSDFEETTISGNPEGIVGIIEGCQ